MACIASLVGQYVEVVAKDLESFAKHAKRTTIAADDVRLCARRMPDMVGDSHRQYFVFFCARACVYVCVYYMYYILCIYYISC